MEEKNRRDFIGKMLLGATSLVSLPLLGSLNSNSSTAYNNSMTKKLIKKIRPLGFQWETLDPFLFCVHHEDHFPKGNGEMGPAASLAGRQIGQDFILKDGWRMYHGDKIPGFPGHPHRGFETVTVVRKGLVDHADSTGASGRYGNGDVQWMTAGKGVQHSEMFPLINTEADNELELFQIWLNLPKVNKMVEPHFKMLWSETIPTIKLNEENVTIEVLAGSLMDQNASAPPPDSWAAVEENHVGIYNIKLAPNQTFTLPKTEIRINRSIYFYEGDQLTIGETSIPSYHAVDVEPDMDVLIQNGETLTKILVLQGRPISEPVVQHGPFVMNTKEEIHQAFVDYQTDRFGGWPWPRYDQVHDAELGRFAKHSNGEEEIK